MSRSQHWCFPRPRRFHFPATNRWKLFPLLVVAFLKTAPATLAQGSQVDYQRALGLARETENTVFRASVQPQWIPGGDGRFWYRVTTGPDRHEWLFVDPERGTREPLFDHTALAARLEQAEAAPGTGRPTISPDGLKLDSLTVELEGGTRVLRFRHGGRRWRTRVPGFALEPDPAPEALLTPTPSHRPPRRSRTTGDETEIVLVNRTTEDVELYWLDDQGTRRPYGRLRPGAERRQHTFAGHVWLGTDRNGTVLGIFTAQEGDGRAEFVSPPGGSKETAATPEPAPETKPGPHDSPDGRWTVEIRDHNLFLRPRSGGEAVRLSKDGVAGDAYHPEVRWSPDSSHLVARRVRDVPPRRVSWIEAAPKDQLQPKLHSHDYFKPGIPCPTRGFGSSRSTD